MPGARSVVFLSAVLLLSACTTIAPAQPPSSQSPAGTVAAATPTSLSVLPTLESPTEEPGIDEPTDAPVDTPTDEPTDSPTEPEPPEEQGPNLVVTKFSVDVDDPLPGEEIEASVTVKNTGDVAAGPYSVALIVDRPDSDEPGDATPVEESEGLEPGASTQLFAIFTVFDVGAWEVVAAVDVDNTVDEPNEDDNFKKLTLDSPSLPNIALEEDAFAIFSKNDGSGKHYALLSYKNRGPAVLDQPFKVRFFWYSPDGSRQGEFGTFDVPQLTMLPDPDTQVAVTFDFYVEPGTYLAYALMDPDNQVAESDEGDNEARYDFDVLQD